MGIPQGCNPRINLLNGNFSDGSAWELGAEWNIAGGKAHFVDAGGPFGQFMRQILEGWKEHVYRLTFTISNVVLTGGSAIFFKLFDTVSIPYFANGTYQVFVTPASVVPANHSLWFYCDKAGPQPNRFDLDNVELLDIFQELNCGGHLLPLDNTKAESLDLGGGQYNMTFAHRSDHSNILIKVDGTAF